MIGIAKKVLRRARAAHERGLWFLFARRLRLGLSPAPSVIASNCIGGRLGEAFAAGYLSPTAGLWFAPDDYLAFVENLADNLKADLVEDAAASAESGYPVGRVNGIAVRFMHYHSFAEAADKWRRRCARVKLDRVLLTFTDRDGATTAHLERFDKLSGARISFVHRPMPHLASSVHVGGYESKGEVGDLYGEWRGLGRAFTPRVIARLRNELATSTRHRGS